MKNAEEHKKLLKQIKELGKNSINYFDVEKEFFLIDSNNLSQVRPRLYGYSIQASGIYENDDLTPEAIAGLDGRGCYVYVDVKDGQITIKQDLNGCWGIYLFRHGDYFALSNSFFRLLEHVKDYYPLTVNRDYCHYLLINDLVSHAYFETPVNEIQLLDRSAILQTDISKKSLEIDLIDYKENTVPLNSQEAITILDNWIELWGSIFRGVAQHTKFISIDLSGGFDSRITFLNALHSGIDLDKIWINSATAKNYAVYIEDYEIASKIVEHYGLTLNKHLKEHVSITSLNYSLTDAFKIKRYCLQPFYKDPWFFGSLKNLEKRYKFSGQGGETIRGYWRRDPKNFIKGQNNHAMSFSSALSADLSHSIENILESAFRVIRKKYKIEDENSVEIPQYLYEETRCRVNYGKPILIEYFRNNITLSPSLDPIIRTLQLDTPECPDPLLLMALIFTRYEPDLLNFPFEGKRSIAPETIEYAKKINERFPAPPEKGKKHENMGGGYFHLSPHDAETEKILALGKNNKGIPGKILENYLNSMFESSRTYGLFTSYFDAELYHYAANFYASNSFGRFRRTYSVWGIAEVLEDVEISNQKRWHDNDKRHFLEDDFSQIDDAAQVVRKFGNYLTARIDIKLLTDKTGGDFQILSVSDGRANIEKPAWLNKGGTGYKIQSYVGNMEFIAKATVDGQIRLDLRGMDVRNPKDRSKRIPYWIDYTKLTINGNVIFDTLTPTWHDKYYRHVMNMKSGEEIKIQAEWLPHRSDT